MRVGEIANAEAQRYGKPLDGVRILAIEQMQALPYATQLLSRLGAEVIKVEHPVDGESGRLSLPAMRDPEGRLCGATFLRNNLGKRSLGIDLKQPEGRDLILQMAPRFDVVAENFKAGTIARLGLAYEDIAKVHPSVIYVSVSGFGNTMPTPYKTWPAYAPVAEAMASLYDFKREPGVPPVVSPLGALGDTGSAMFAVIGVLAALRHRDTTGEGQYVDIAMYDAMVALADAGINYWSMGLLDGGRAPLINHSFRASDGFFIIQCGRQHQFAKLAELIGHPEWLDDPRLKAAPDWFEHLEDIIRPGIETWAADKTRMEAATLLGTTGVASGPVHSAADVVVDEHVANRHMLVEMERTDGVEQPILSPGNPVKLSKMAEGPETRVPWVGEHTAEVLAAELGVDADELDRLRSIGVIA